MLRDAGISGTVMLWVKLDDEGNVARTRVAGSSGHEALDEAAERVMREARFTPALHQDRRVAVWIQLPITFQTRTPPS
jgi:periplasmic protein TonB